MLRIILNLLLFLISNTNCHDYHGWDDSILFKLDWANGDLAKLQEVSTETYHINKKLEPRSRLHIYLAT